MRAGPNRAPASRQSARLHLQQVDPPRAPLFHLQAACPAPGPSGARPSSVEQFVGRRRGRLQMGALVTARAGVRRGPAGARDFFFGQQQVADNGSTGSIDPSVSSPTGDRIELVARSTSSGRFKFNLSIRMSSPAETQEDTHMHTSHSRARPIRAAKQARSLFM